MNFKKEALKGFLFIFLAIVVGCASTDSSDYRQTVLVTSEPPGALIFDRGQQIGVTPAYVRVRRRAHPAILLKYPGQPDFQAALKSSYRWGDSFWANFLFLIYAPIGWGVDLLTGTAWKIDDPPPVKWSVVGAKPSTDKPQVVAVAPPIIADWEGAEGLGPVLESKVRKSLGLNVLPYEQTAPIFGYYNSDQGLTERRDLKYNLFYDLKADHILVTRAEPNPEGYLVTGHLKSALTGNERDQFWWEITPTEGTLRQRFSKNRWFNNYFHLLPNTIFLNISQYQSSVVINDQTYKGRSPRTQGFTNELLDYISFLSLAHLTRPRAKVKGRWVIDFVPTLNISEKRIIFEGYAPLKDIEFNRWYVSGGYGLEVGHLSRVGFFYLDFIPLVTWTQISFSTDLFDEKLARTNLTTMNELGYTYFLTNHLIGKLFVRTFNENLGLWEKAVHDITGRDEAISSVSSAFVGFALGYYIPSSLSQHSGWRVNERR